MRVYEIRDGFGLQQLRRGQRDASPPGPGQALVEVRACSLNYRDLLMLLGQYNPRQPLPLVPLSDGAGVVAAVGPGVTRVKPGDRVAAIFAEDWISGPPDHERIRRSTRGGPLDGMLREQALIAERGLVRFPEHLSYAEAATLPCAALTAWTALTGYRPLLPGETVLIQGTGGVSLFALQFAGLLGATTILTSSSDAKLERAGELGADHLINYKTSPDWHKQARALTGKRGVDRVVEVGGAGTFQQSLQATRMGGFIAMIGVLAGASAPLNVLPVLMSSLTVQGIQVGSRDDFEAMNRAIAAHRLRPVIGERCGFDAAADAFALMQRGGHFGKIVIDVDAG